MIDDRIDDLRTLFEVPTEERCDMLDEADREH